MDEFDHALMEALNEAVPSADFATDLAGRLVARTRRRARFWKLLLALGLFSAATAAVTTLSGDETAETAAPHMESRHLGGDSTGPSSTIHYSLFPIHSPQGAPTVQTTTLKKAAALMGATALAAGPLGDVSVADSLEARARTCDDSTGIALRSDEYNAMMIIFR